MPKSVIFMMKKKLKLTVTCDVYYCCKISFVILFNFNEVINE